MMKKTGIFFSLILVAFMLPQHAISQDLIGLWMVSKVTVGDETMTPTAKWTRFDADSTYSSGNGWLQHSAGTWHYDDVNDALTMNEQQGLTDKYGAFTVTFNGNQMLWERQEDALPVVVVLDRIEDLPMAPADSITGVWDLVQAKKDGKDITNTFDPHKQFYIFFRWDRVYVERTADGKSTTGFWQMHAHRPELTMIPRGTSQSSRYRVSFSGRSMTLEEKDSQPAITLRFEKRNSIPD